MKDDRAGVAGFFEDLPVLMFVLAGVFALVLTSTFAAGRLAEGRSEARLEKLAKDFVDSFTSNVIFSRGTAIMPTLSCMRSVNYSELIRESVHDRDFLLSICSLHPYYSCILTICTDWQAAPDSTAFASRLINALDDRNTCIVLEVSAIVW